MRLPFVSRKRYRALEVNVDGMVSHIASLQAQLTDQRAKVEHLRGLCNGFERKQRDLDEPPISAEDLQSTLRRLAVIQTENGALREVNKGLELQVAEWRARAEQGASPPAVRAMHMLP